MRSKGRTLVVFTPRRREPHRKPASSRKTPGVAARPARGAELKHLLVDMVAIAVCACWLAAMGRRPSAVRRTTRSRGGVLALPQGPPSKDCLRRVLSLLNPEAFTRRFSAWIAEYLSTDEEGRLVAVDGKTLRRSHDRKNASGRCTW